MRETPLHDTHAALGAKLIEFAGWHMPVQYGSILAEVRRVRTKVGLFDLSHMGRHRVTGPDAVKLVDHIATNYCAKIPVGAIRYALYCREDGSPIDDLLVYRGEDEILLVVNAGNADEDLAWIRKHAAGLDVEIEDQTESIAMIALQGQQSQAILDQVTENVDLAGIGYYRFGFGTVLGIDDVRLSRTGYTGEDGFELYVPADAAVRVWNALLEAGAEHGLQPIGLGARDTLRLEAGMALYGHEIDRDHDPIQAGLSFGIKFAEAKGDWIGRSALLAIRENPTRELVGLVTPGPRVPRQGYTVLRGDEVLGEIVSGAVSPTLDTNIATAYVKQGAVEIGSKVEMDIRGKRQECTVHTLPFFSRTRK